MPPDRSVRGLQLNQNLKHEVTEWKLERIAWVLMALILVAALAGLLGPGPLSHGVAGDQASGFWVEYRKFEHYRAPSALVIHIKSRSSQVRLWLSHGFMRNIDLRHIDPVPERSEAGSDRYVFPFSFSDTREEIIVTVYFEPNQCGMMDTEIGLENGPSLGFAQLVYP